MNKRFGRLVTFAAAFLFSSTAFAADGVLGSTALSLVENQTSVFGLDVKALEWEVCGNPNFDPTIRGAVILIANDGGGNSGDRSRMAVEVLGQQTGPVAGTSLASVRPVLFELLGGSILSLSCGAFTFQVLLDSQVEQPVSILTLVTGGRSGTSGTCAGNLAVAARLFLTPVGDTVPSFDTPRRLTLQIAGHWALSIGPTFKGTSSLILLADRVGDRIVPRPACFDTADELRSHLCFAGEVPESTYWPTEP